MLHGGHPVPTLTHTDWAEDRAREWWGAHPPQPLCPPLDQAPRTGSPSCQHLQVRILNCAPGPACLLAPTHTCPYPGRRLDS